MKCISQHVLTIKSQFAEAETGVIIPFTNLHELFPKEIVRDMRDFQQFCQFLKTLPALNFLQRPFMKRAEKNGEKRFVLCTVEDVRRALEVYSELFETTRTGTEAGVLCFYYTIVKAKEAWYLQELTAKYNEVNVKKVSSDLVRKILQRLSDIGYVTVEADSEDRRLNVYKPLVKEEEKAEVHRYLDSPLILSSKLEMGFKDWQKIIGFEGGLYYYKNFSESKWGEAEISMEEASRIILEGASPENFSFSTEEVVNPIIFSGESKPKTEKKPEISGEPDYRQSSANSKVNSDRSEEDGWIQRREGIKVISKTEEVMLQCPFCRGQGKPIYFSSEHDLKRHVDAWHTGQPNPNYVR